MQDFIDFGEAGVVNSEDIRAASATAQAIDTAFPDTQLGKQLAIVARAISIQRELGVSRQVFYTTMGSFDTHSGQTGVLPVMQQELSEAMLAFRNAMIELNVYNNVTTFTASEFGRTIRDNGDGTDHGWGGHHFVMGGAVRGGSIFGEMAPLELGGERFTKKRARLIPGIAVEQYAATLGKWFGLDGGELNAALPNLNNFNQADLGFMG